MVLPIQQRWSVHTLIDRESGGQSYVAEANPITPDLSPGHLTIESASAYPGSCYNQFSQPRYFDGGPFVTRFVWTAADGSQTTLVDELTGGESQGPSDCFAIAAANYQLTNRQRRFRSRDCSNIEFIANSDIYDYASLYTDHGNSSNGTLIFPNGLRYQVEGGQISQIKDRNGNVVQLSFGYNPSGQTISISDSLNRTISVQPSGNTTTVDYPGAQGARRTITINKSNLEDNLDSNESLESYHCLFPELYGGSALFNPVVVSSVVLADNSSYSFKYNSYGEVTTVMLPTGGSCSHGDR